MCGPDCRHQLFEQGRQRAEMSITQLWVQYIALGGSLDLFSVEAYLHGLMPLPPFQQDVLANALNERLDDIYRAARVPYLITEKMVDLQFDEPVDVLRELTELKQQSPKSSTDGADSG